MAGAVDATMRPLKIPTKFVPYLENNRIYDLFYVSYSFFSEIILCSILYLFLI